MKTTIVYKGKIVYKHTILHKILFLTELPQSGDFSKINKKDIINQGTPFYPFFSSPEQRDQNIILLYVLIRGSEVRETRTLYYYTCSYEGLRSVTGSTVSIMVFSSMKILFSSMKIQTTVRLASNYSSSYVHLTYI
jgi:hypothetical protein